MQETIVEILVLELAGALRIKGEKVLAWNKATLGEAEAKELEKQGLLKILGEAEVVETEPVGEPEILDPQPKINVAPTTTAEGGTLEAEEKPTVPVIEPNKTAETTEKVIDKAEIEAEVARLVKEYSFKDLAEHAKSLGLTKTVWISAKDLATNIVEKSIELQK